VPRPVVPYKLTWLDRAFRKSFDVLPPAKKAKCKEQISELIEALKECSHPLKDQRLQGWRPSAYYVANFKLSCKLVEYRLDSDGLRVVVCYFDGKPDIVLATATLTHDHEGMRKLLREHARRLAAL
jgi:hypothetical protein